MKFDLEKASKTLGFNEERLVENCNILLEAYRNKRNVFSLNKPTCESILPEDIERDSREYTNYLTFMSIPNLMVDANVLFEKGRLLYKKEPWVFEPSEVFEKDKDQLKIVKRKRSKIFVAPHIDEILSKELEHGLHEALSGKWYKTARKLHRVYDDDSRNVFKYVTDFDVALRRLDVGKSKQPIEREVRNTSFPRFGGFGNKTGPLLIIWFIKYGFIKDMDRFEIKQPIDAHGFNLYIGRGITDIDERIRKEKFTRNVQELLRDAFKRNNIPPIDFHYAQWRLGSEVCNSNNCYNLRTEDGKERLCPFPTPCKYYLDSFAYRRQGFIEKQLGNFSNQVADPADLFS